MDWKRNENKKKNHRNEMETEWCEQKSCNCWKRTSQQKGMFHQKSVVMLPLEMLYQMITSQFIITKRLTMWFFFPYNSESHRPENSSSEIFISFSVFRILIKKNILCFLLTSYFRVFFICWHHIFGRGNKCMHAIGIWLHLSKQGAFRCMCSYAM